MVNDESARVSGRRRIVLGAARVARDVSGTAAIPPTPAGGAPPRAWLTRARDELHDRFLDPPRIRELAAAAGVHPDHLARAFRLRFGVPIGLYLRRLRLDLAATRLETSDATISAITLDAGRRRESIAERLTAVALIRQSERINSSDECSLKRALANV